MYVKDFDQWNIVKKRIQIERRKVYFRSGEVRWCAVGVNLGSEIDGKGESFTRPVLVLHVIGANLVLIVPLTTKNKHYPGYFPFEFQGRQHSLCIHQIKIVSSKRLLKRKGKVTKNRLRDVRTMVNSFYKLR